MRKRIFRSMLSVTMSVLIISLIVASTFMYDYFNQSQVRRLKEELSLVEETVNRIGIEHLENFNSSIFRFTVVSKDGMVLYDNKADKTGMENHGQREEIIEAFSQGTGSSVRNSDTMTQKTFYEAVLLDNGCVLRISVSQIGFITLIFNMLPFVGVIMLISVIFALILSNNMAKKISKPLLEFDLEHPVKDVGYEEVAPILTRLHNQHKQIKTQMETLRRKTDEFEQIIFSMNEGLVLLDEHGMILSMNPSAKKIFSVNKTVSGLDFLSIDKTSKMNKAIFDALSGKHGEYTEERQGNEYQFNINPIKSDGKILGVVIFAFDITDKAFAQRNRQEFTANVSHELKTPLQSIIGSAELLESGLVKEEDTKKFIGNIHKEATRLVDLINDIIRLSQLDEGKEITSEKVNLTEVTREVFDVLNKSAQTKNVSLELKGEDCSVSGIRRYIYEIIYNLCDNAIRYNKDGGFVTVNIKEENSRVTVEVSDTGIGIAPEHHSRIFERFYRVDKSHSKETGGTGLGLSIVKHAVKYHGGNIEMTSTPAKGTSIKITF